MMRRIVMMLVFLVGLGVLAGCARTTPTEAAALQAAAADHTAYVLAPAVLAKAESLQARWEILWVLGTVWGIVQLWLLLELGVVARMRNVAVNLSKNRWAQGFTFVLELLIVTAVLNLPLAMYGHHVAVSYGLSVQGWGGWLGDRLKGMLIEFVLGGLGVMMLYWLIRKFPRRWWLPAWGLACCLVVAGVFATPYVIDPLFNKFEPLQQSNPALVAQLEKVVARGRLGGGKAIAIPPERMFLMKASSKTTTLNAYVTGFGASKRVVVWDTSIAKFTPDEIALVFGHEMGHYVLGHILAGVLASFALLFCFFCVGFYGFQWLLRVRGKRWRVPAQGNWASLVVMLLVLAVLEQVALPIANAISRADEHAADVYGQEVVHGVVADPEAAGQHAFDVLGENSLDPPGVNAVYQWWTGNHPAIDARAGFAKHYDPWAPGAAPKYFPKEGR